MPQPFRFSRASIVRIVLDLVIDELSASRGRSALALGAADWTEATRLDAAGLDLDSLERLDASAALNEYFHLHVYGAEDYLLSLASIGEWCDLVEQSLDATAHLTFRTSGSTGVPKRCTHAIADLMVEVDAWARMLDPGRIVALVPAHHIYGTVFAAMLPDRIGVPCRPGRFAPGGAIAGSGPGSLIVGTPTMWAHASRSVLAFPVGMTGVSSTAPLSAQLAAQLRAQRLGRLVEIYGSSETGGIAHRSDPTAPFALLDHWKRGDGRGGEDGLVRPTADGGDLAVPMPDVGVWLDDCRFALDGRRDGAVQIGGHNVFPDRIRDRLLAHAGVADAAVRLDARGRLKAFVVPEASADDALIDDLDGWCAGALRDHERPRRFTVGGALPRNAMGKLADW